jgi:RND family efflux transporter MFP subunit
MNKTPAIAATAILVLALAGWGYAKKSGDDAARAAAAKQKKPAPVTVEVVKPKPASISNQVTALGSLESPFTVKLSPNIAGRIDYLNVREGDEVHQGEVLVRIDPEQVEGQILQAQATLAQAEHSLAQVKITQTANTISINSTINQDKAAEASALADYNEAEVTYEATVAAAHEATVDAQSKVRSAGAQVQTAQANVELAEANLRDAQAKYTREYSLYSQGLVAPQDVDDAKAAFKGDQATVNAQKHTLQSSQAALASADQEEKEAENQEAITRKKGMSTIVDAKGVLTQARATLRAAVANRSQIPAYEANLRALQAQVVAAKASLNQAIAQRAFLIVKSSIEGTVTQRLADTGAEASPGSQILVVQYLKWLFLTAYLPVELADDVKPGTQCDIVLDAFPNQVFNGAISDINKAAGQTSRQFMVRIRLDNPKGLFHPGMYARVSLVGSMTSAKVAVPTKAVNFATNGSATVTTVDSKNLAHIVSVQFGATDTKHTEILSGITLKDRVVIATESPLSEETEVTIGKVVKKRPAGGGSEPSGATSGGGAGSEAAPTTAGGAGGEMTSAGATTSGATTSGATITGATSSGAAAKGAPTSGAASSGVATPSATTSGVTNAPVQTGSLGSSPSTPNSGSAPTVNPGAPGNASAAGVGAGSTGAGSPAGGLTPPAPSGSAAANGGGHVGSASTSEGGHGGTGAAAGGGH